MPAGISLSMEREPNYFAGAAMDGSEHQTIVAIEDGRVVCAGTIGVSSRFLNGVAARVGYLSGLRLDRACRSRPSILRQGYQVFHDLHRRAGEPAVYLTSIFSANARAIRFFERNLPWMPTYRRIADFVTVVLRVRPQLREADGAASGCAAAESDLPLITDLLNRQNEQLQFAPVWSVEKLKRCSALQAADFRLARDRDDHLAWCAAVWDQRAVRQTVVRGYPPMLRRMRPLVNFGARLLRTPRLPAVGKTIPLAFASHIAATPDSLPAALRSLETAASQRGIEYLTVGFDARDPRLGVVRRHFKGREYSSRIYLVYWEDGAQCAEAVADGIVAPEAALL